MANIKKLLDFRENIISAIDVLIKLDNAHYPLPELGHLQNILAELKNNCQPEDVIADIVSDNDYLQHKNLYTIPLQALFKCDFGVGCALVNGVEYDWWDGLNDRLESQGYDENGIKEYTKIADNITFFVKGCLHGLKRDLICIGVIDDCERNSILPDVNQQCVGHEAGDDSTPNKDDILLRSIFGEHLSDFMKEALVCKKGSDVAGLVNWYVREYKLKKSKILNKPLREALNRKGIDTASKATWNNIIRNK